MEKTWQAKVADTAQLTARSGQKTGTERSERTTMNPETPAPDPLKEDFRNFMFLAFKVMGITPHPIQYQVANWLQNASNRRILSCFRVFGKTIIIASYIAWRFYQDPNTLILVQSASSERSKEIVSLVRQILSGLEFTAHLVPDGRDKEIKNQAQRFDIAVRTAKGKDPSLAAYGHRSMITGAHVHEIIADDLETPENSYTVDARTQLMEKIAEYEDVIIPDGPNRITLIGTPQTEESIYFTASALGYEMIRVPAEYPETTDENYDTIAPFLKEALEAGTAAYGDPTYPERLDLEALERKKAITPPARYQLQMLLNPKLSDAERYPLKLRDLIVFDSDPEVFPSRLVWSNATDQRIMIPSAGFSGDYFFGPRKISDEYVPFSRKVMWIDPSGRGADAATFAVAYGVPSYIYIPEVGGFQDAFSEEGLTRLAVTALKHRVDTVFVEANYGGGAYAELLKPYLRRFKASCSVEDRYVKGQKETRMIDVLRPVMGTHRLVVSTDVAQTAELAHQLTRLWASKGCLEHDDYVDALHGAVSELIPYLDNDYLVTEDGLKEARLQEMVDTFWAKIDKTQPKEDAFLNRRMGLSSLRNALPDLKRPV